MTMAWIGLGSNLQDPVEQIKGAMRALATLPQSRLCAQSSLYRTAPVGGVAQPDFINAVAGLETCLDPLVLFAALLGIEHQAGRSREQETRWGPRVLDLDVLLYGSQSHSSDDLQIPHPRLAQRAFVLGPLAEVAGAWRLPDGRSVAALWAACPDREQIQLLADH